MQVQRCGLKSGDLKKPYQSKVHRAGGKGQGMNSPKVKKGS